MNEKFSVKKFLFEHKRDLVLILSLVFISIVLLIFALLAPKEGNLVIVEVNGEEIARYPLSKDAEYDIGDKNTLAIKDGAAYMKHADCPDGTCMRTREISKNGQSIVCLPDRVSVTVVTDHDDGAPDLTSGGR